MKSKNLKYIILLVLIFSISANLAWLNPQDNNPEKPRLYKTHNTIPLFWQYNLDAGVEILTAAYFPKIFEFNTTRIDRPTYPVLANFFGKTASLILKPFIDLNKLESAGIGYLILKILMYSLSIILIRNILLRYFDEKTTFLAIFFLYSSYHSIFYFTAFHTSELQFITPIFILSFFIYLINKYSITKNILFSILIGILMLAKPNYAVYLSIIIFLLYKKKLIEVLISIFAHLIPIFLYLLFIEYSNYNFAMTGVTDYDQGTWLYNDLKNGNFYKVFSLFFILLGKFITKLFAGYNLLVIFLILGFLIKYRKNEIKKDYIIFISIFIFYTYFQSFAAMRFNYYMVYDISIIVFSFSAYFIYQIIEKFKNENIKKYSIPLIMALWFIINISQFISLPWVHPYNQVSKSSEVLNSKLSKLDKDIIIKD
jgi:hypothetical protein